jgi:TATA-box binding protein (TBP) (component of TFIID and TFIIIB)
VDRNDGNAHPQFNPSCAEHVETHSESPEWFVGEDVVTHQQWERLQDLMSKEEADVVLMSMQATSATDGDETLSRPGITTHGDISVHVATSHVNMLRFSELPRVFVNSTEDDSTHRTGWKRTLKSGVRDSRSMPKHVGLSPKSVTVIKDTIEMACQNNPSWREYILWCEETACVVHGMDRTKLIGGLLVSTAFPRDTGDYSSGTDGSFMNEEAREECQDKQPQTRGMSTPRVTTMRPPRLPLLGSLRCRDTDEFTLLDVGTINNMVYTTHIGRSVNLFSMTANMHELANFNALRFPAMIIRLSKESTTLVFSPGNIVMTGCSTNESAMHSARTVSNLLAMHGQTIDHLNIKLRNVVGNVDIGIPINLDVIADAYGSCVQFEPDVFPGLIFRTPFDIGGRAESDTMLGVGASHTQSANHEATPATSENPRIPRRGATILIFDTGKMVVTGNVDEYGLRHTHPYIRHIRRLAAVAARYPFVENNTHHYKRKGGLFPFMHDNAK